MGRNGGQPAAAFLLSVMPRRGRAPAGRPARPRPCRTAPEHNGDDHGGKTRGADPAGRILLEEDPGVAKAGEKLYFEARAETRIFIRRGGGQGDARPATAGELAKGQTVDAWHTGHSIMESYPGQTVASEVVIALPPRT